jgi:ATP/ADP translocase/HEAT repeat protein
LFPWRFASLHRPDAYAAFIVPDLKILPMKLLLLRVLETLFPVRRHEWPKVLVLLGVATLLGMGFSVSGTASEGLFLTRLGVQYLPMLLLVNPLLVLVASAVYGAFADRIPNDRMLVYTSLLPVPLIFLMYFLIMLEANWVYFLLYTFVLAYASVLTTSWTVYLGGHYDVQESKRLLPFISSGILIGTVLGGMGVAICAPLIGAANVLLLWLVTSIGVAGVVWWFSRRFMAMETEARRVKRGAKQPSPLQSLKEGIAFSRTSSLFMTTTIVTIATMVALQLIGFEYSKIFARAYPEPAALTAFLGIFDGVTTIAALLLQWFVTPWCIRRFGVQGTNLFFPYILTVAFGGLLVAPALPTAMFARFTRSSLMPSLRGTTRTLMLNVVPRKMAARVRSFNTGIVLPVGQGLGALTLVALKGLDLPLLFPVLGFLVSVFFIFYSYRQNKAYGEALLGLLKEDKIHLLDLDDNEIRQLDAAAVAAIGERLKTDQMEVSQMAAELPEEQGQFLHEIARAQEEVSLTAIELLRTIGSPHAFAVLRQHVPFASLRLTAAALQALAAMGGKEAIALLRPYLYDAHPQVRMAAITGLRQLDEAALLQDVATLLDDTDVQVRAAALALVLSRPTSPDYARAYQAWEAMLAAEDEATQVAALSIMATVPHPSLQGHIYRALHHPAGGVRHAALRVLRQLAESRRVAEVDAALLHALEDNDMETRELALQALAAIGTDEALNHMLVLLDDEQPQVRDTLVRTIKPFGRRAIAPLLQDLRSPQTSLLAKETALLALARLDGVQADQLLPFWEGSLRDVYQYKLMLACLETHQPLDADAFLRVALRNAHDQILSLLVQLLAVWASPDVARLVESGLHDPDRHKRAHALEALESLSERRFTRLFLPILEASEEQTDAWQEVARHQWHLTCDNVPAVIDACVQSADKWIVIGALLSGQARAAAMGDAWTTRLQQLAESADDAETRNTARRLLGLEVETLHQHLTLTEAMLFLKRAPLFSSLSLDQLHTITIQLTERTVEPGEVIMHEGDHSRELYLVVSGKVDIVRGHGASAHTVFTYATGGYFGERAIFENRPRSASAVAVESGVLLVLSPEHFRQVILQEPAISFEIFREFSARIRRFDEEASEVAH